MRFHRYPEMAEWPGIIARPVQDVDSLEKIVRPVLEDVRLSGDDALRDYTEKFDGYRPDAFKTGPEEIRQAEKKITSALREAIEVAAGNIRKFHEQQLTDGEKVETTSGISCWRKTVAIESVGLYIPGGSAPLFSTVLMLGIPATIAGCKRIVLCTPPSKDGNVNPAILYAAHKSGITDIYKVGGAQAIGAMAYGTQTIPKVNKIFGPGNQYVTMAKQLVASGGVAIDMPAGPSEVLVIADAGAPVDFVASDLLAQAEHGPDSQAVLVSDSEELIQKVSAELEVQLSTLPRRDIAARAMEGSFAVLVRNLKEAVEFSNFYAPEHLIISSSDAGKYAREVTNAGSVFLGYYTPESLGDYASGTNHTLPTNGYAKAYSGVSLDSFVKKITFQSATRQGLRTIAKYVEVMAEAEELEGHKRSVTYRLNQLNGN